ncbi:MAG: (2Fe-2S)-binding protein [Chloroflexi bacterium]|nr:(2Fe-2S)-binding protein [Chloroflexota bacterium]|tara:strand:+ start:23758 stop:24078 length:321 start_codon:yes stop_codon:yes gene_type:complete
MSEKYFEVADTSDIELNHSISVNIEGNSILISHTDEGFFAVEDMCTHALIPLCGGLIQGTLISCPLHGAVFDLKTGEVMSPPAFEDLKTFKLKINGTTISVLNPKI